MACEDCKDNATPEEILELIQHHHARLEEEYTRRLEEAVAEIRRLTALSPSYAAWSAAPAGQGATVSTTRLVGMTTAPTWWQDWLPRA